MLRAIAFAFLMWAAPAAAEVVVDGVIYHVSERGLVVTVINPARGTWFWCLGDHCGPEWPLRPGATPPPPGFVREQPPPPPGFVPVPPAGAVPLPRFDAPLAPPPN